MRQAVDVLPQPIPFGRYKLVERIGRGGMAEVFRARIEDTAGLERDLVVKRILPHLSDDPSFTKMLVEEAKLVAKLDHPNIVAVLELGTVGDEYFLAMEHVRGRDLSATMRAHWEIFGPPRPELVAYIGREMCRALAYAHAFRSDDGEVVGVVHRDVSPSNVMLSYEGAVKLLDFGIAKALEGEGSDERTKTGILKGKLGYMAPEQAMGRGLDTRIDIFATGVVLHEILSGRRLFKGENDMQTIDNVRRCKVSPPSTWNPLCTPELDRIVLKALAKNRDRRYQSAAELADALDEVTFAARFQAPQLAQIMRALFAATRRGEPRPITIPGGRLLPGTVQPRSPSQLSNGGWGRVRNPTSPTPSPMVPAVSVSSPLVTDTHRLFRSYGAVRALASLLTRPLIGTAPGWMIMAALLMVGFTFTAGVTWSSRWSSAASAPKANPASASRGLDVAFQSSPMGADVYVAGSNELLGHTPFRRKLEQRTDQPTVVVFRLPGYVETTQEVRPDRLGSMSVELVPLPHAQVVPIPANEPARSLASPAESPRQVAKAKPSRVTGQRHAKAVSTHPTSKQALPRRARGNWRDVGPFQ